MIDTKLVPSEPGCYLFKDKDGNIIYIGKAKNLKKRVSSYFQKKNHDPKTQSLVENIAFQAGCEGSIPFTRSRPLIICCIIKPLHKVTVSNLVFQVPVLPVLTVLFCQFW